MVYIRFGYCPPNPGPKKKLKCKWYTDKNTAIEEYDGRSPIYTRIYGRYQEITYEQLLNL